MMSDPKSNDPALLEVFTHSLQEFKDEILANCADTSFSDVTYNYVLKSYCDGLVDKLSPQENNAAGSAYVGYQSYWQKIFNGAVGPVTTEIITQVLNATLPSLGGLEKIISHASGEMAGKLASRVAENNSTSEIITKPSV